MKAMVVLIMLSVQDVIYCIQQVIMIILTFLLYFLDEISVEYDEETFEAKPPLPKCNKCNSNIM